MNVAICSAFVRRLMVADRHGVAICNYGLVALRVGLSYFAINKPIFQQHEQQMLSFLKRKYSSCRLSSSASSFLPRGLHLPKEWHHPNFMYKQDALDKEAWLKSLLKTKTIELDTEAFLIVLRALAVSDLPDAALRAERWLLRLMEHRRLHGNDDDQGRLTVSSECYQRVIEAWAAALTEDPAIALTRAERWLQNYNEESSLTQPDTACYNAFLDLCSKGRALKDGTKGRWLVRQHALKAEHTLLEMIADAKRRGVDQSRKSPNTDSFNYVIRAFTRMRFDPSIADKSMEVLRLLEQYQETMDERVKPDLKSYTMVMDAIAVRARQTVQQNIHKKHLWNDPAQNGMDDIKLLKEIIAYMRVNKVTKLEPSTHIYNVLISAWANISSPMHPEAPFEAEKVLQFMIRARDQGEIIASPDSSSFQMVMRAWKNSDKPGRGSRVTWWLQKQWGDYEFEGYDALQPTTHSYNLVMQVWAALGEPTEAEKCLTELTRLGEYGGFINLSPNTESYAAVIKAWLAVANNGSHQGLEAAATLMRYVAQQDKGDQRNVLSSVDWYSMFLSATRKCAKHFRALELATEMFEQLKESHHAVDCLHYARLIQTGLVVMSQEQHDRRRGEFIRIYVVECCEQGLMSRPLIRAIVNGPVYYDGWTIEESRRCRDDVFPDWPFPAAWTRNIRQEGFLPQRSDLMRRNFHISHHGRPFEQE
ncbi:hypothetical protein MPSEU_000393100 [Mayamaea pseudoterrestris]|nr:hypothetical protein MPSEU_000393100 [Mayamaea pseudoterrestris]